MFVDLFGLDRFENETLVSRDMSYMVSFLLLGGKKVLYVEFNSFSQVRFFITVKKNYRSVAYHNWAHGDHIIYHIISYHIISYNIMSW